MAQEMVPVTPHNLPPWTPIMPKFDPRWNQMLRDNGFPSKIINAAKKGYWQPGWELGNYLHHTPRANGWDSVIIWGPKGSFKSNRGNAFLWKVYQDWDTVAEYMIMHPEQFIDLIEQKGRMPAMAWDDMPSWLDSGLYCDNRSLYLKVKRYWWLLRTKISVFFCTCVNKSKLAGFVLDDMTSEVQLSPRGVYDYDRWAWQKNLKNPKKVDMFPVMIHKERPFSIHWVEYPYILDPETLSLQPDPREPQRFPEDHWQKYWDRRLEYTERSQDAMKGALNELVKDAPTTEEIIESTIKYKIPANAEDLDTALRSVAGKIMRAPNPSTEPGLLKQWKTVQEEIDKALKS